jgi:cysteinyl-tRNA synthetase
VNELFNIPDEDLLFIDQETMDFINLREEFRKQKQFDKTDSMREELKKIYIFEDENTGFSLIRKFN